MFQPRQHHLLTRLLDLARQENLVQYRIHLVEVKHQIQLTHVPEKLIQHFNKEMYRFEIRELVVVGVDTYAEEEPRVAAVDDLGTGEVLADEGSGGGGVGGRGGERGGSEFDEVGLVFLVARRDKAVDLVCDVRSR